jgi:hypothetical protein
LTAGFFGFILQRLVLLRIKAEQADMKVAVVETKHSPREVYMSSMRARTEMMIWIFILVILVIAVVWIYVS